MTGSCDSIHKRSAQVRAEVAENVYSGHYLLPRISVEAIELTLDKLEIHAPHAFTVDRAWSTGQ